MKRIGYLLLVLFVGLILVGCQHKHSYTEEVVAPTCIEKGYTRYTCEGCEDAYKGNYVEALGHSYGEWKVVKEATEETTGLRELECSVCKEKVEQVIPTLAHTHKFEAGKVVEATCTEKGYTEYKCACGETKKGDEVAALGHKEEKIAGKAATCTEKGLTEGKKCSVCNTILVAQKEVAALGHKEEKIAGKEATCTATGLTEGKKCSVCNEVLVAQKEVAKAAHKEEVIAAVAATCTKTGLTEGKKCSVCNTVLVEQVVVEAKGHTEEIIPAVAATCTATGNNEYYTCSSCKNV